MTELDNCKPAMVQQAAPEKQAGTSFPGMKKRNSRLILKAYLPGERPHFAHASKMRVPDTKTAPPAERTIRPGRTAKPSCPASAEIVTTNGLSPHPDNCQPMNRMAHLALEYVEDFVGNPAPEYRPTRSLQKLMIRTDYADAPDGLVDIETFRFTTKYFEPAPGDTPITAQTDHRR